METRAVRTLEVTIGRSFDETYDFLVEPVNFPRWASGLGRGIEQVGDDWFAATEQGRAEVRFTPRNPFGVLDHTVHFAGGRVVEIPMRLLANGDGSTLTFTLFRQPEMSASQFEADAEWVRGDLARLREILEARTAG